MLRIAAQSVDIRPRQPVVLACASDRTPTMEVSDPIEANLALLDDGHTRVLIASLDSLYAGKHVRAALENALASEVDSRGIMVAASHTHYSPSLDYGKPALGLSNPAHLDEIVERIVMAAVALVKAPTVPARLGFKRYQSHAAINRRLPRLIGGVEGHIRFRAVVLAPNPGATVPQFGHVIALEGPDGSPLCVIWQLPCHPVSAPNGTAISAHFPGFVRRRLRQMWGPELPVIFLQGHSGDLRPPSVARPRGVVGHARRLLLGPWFGAFSEREYSLWLEEVFSEFIEALKEVEPNGEPVDLDFKRVEVPLSELAEPLPPLANATASIQRISIGPLDLIGVSAEPVAAWDERIRSREAPGRMRIPVGCIDDTFGYAPTGLMIREGGYESAGFCPHFQLRALRPDFALRLSALIELVATTDPDQS